MVVYAHKCTYSEHFQLYLCMHEYLQIDVQNDIHVHVYVLGATAYHMFACGTIELKPCY